MLYCRDGRHDHLAVLVFFFPRLSDHLGPSANSPLSHVVAIRYLEYAARIVYCECHVAHPVAVPRQMLVDSPLARVQWRLEDKDYSILTDGPRDILAVSGLQSLVANRVEAKSGDIPAGRLLGVPHPECHMVKPRIFANVRLFSSVCI